MTVGFFMPLPLAVMIPFMAGQSFAMGEAFGKGFQYGKRRISAMTNEQFNAMSAKDHFEETTADISAMIPSMKSQMNNFSTLQTDIIKTLIEQLKDAGITIGEAIRATGEEIFTQGPTGGTEVAQSSLDQLRSIVGLPPIYAKLVSPVGIAALFSFWNRAGKSKLLKATLNPVNWVFGELKRIFKQSPPSNIVTQVIGNAPIFIGPLFQNQDISIFDKDTRLQEELANIPKTPPPTVPIIQNKRKAGQSQILEMKKLQREIQEAQRAFGSESSQARRKILRATIARVYQLMQNLRARYIF